MFYQSGMHTVESNSSEVTSFIAASFHFMGRTMQRELGLVQVLLYPISKSGSEGWAVKIRTRTLFSTTVCWEYTVADGCEASSNHTMAPLILVHPRYPSHQSTNDGV